MYVRTRDTLKRLPTSYLYDSSIKGVGGYMLGDSTPPNGPITAAKLADSLTNLVFWARHPDLEGKTLKPKTKEAAEWRQILKDEVTPALHNSSTRWKISQLIFFSRHPDIRGHFKEQPEDKQKKLWKEFEDIRDNIVQPWLALKIEGTQVLYVRPTPPKPKIIDKIEYTWSFDTAEGRREYEAALDKHLKGKKLVSGDTVYEPLSSSADIAKLANTKLSNLVLIVHGAYNGPAIAVDLGNSAAGTSADWIKADEFAKLIAPFGYKNITILGCDSVSNKFTPNLAKSLPKGSTVIGHKGDKFVITSHFDPNKKVPGQLQLTRVKSNLQLKDFKTEGD